MKDKFNLLTILDTISETSMPLNEFILYRLKKYPKIKQYIIVCEKKKDTTIEIPNEINIYYVDKKSELMQKAINEILYKNILENKKLIVHLHQIKSALLFYKATFFIRNKNYKTLFTVHSNYNLRSLKYKISSVLCSLMADRVTCVSKSGYKDYSEIVKFIKGKRISYIQNGVDISRVDFVVDKMNYKEPKIDDKKIIHFVYIGRIIPIKNQIVLVNAFKDLEGCELTLVGAENKDSKIRKLIEELQLTKKIHITGMIERNKVFEILKSSNVYISSSLIEGLPVSVLEAMAVGLPVVLSNIDSHKEIARESTGIKIINNTVEEWKKILKEYINMDDDKLKKLGDQCRRCVVNNFSLEKMHSLYDKEYEKLI